MEVNPPAYRSARTQQLINQLQADTGNTTRRRRTAKELVEEACQRKPSPLEQMAEERAKARNTPEGGG